MLQIPFELRLICLSARSTTIRQAHYLSKRFSPTLKDDPEHGKSLPGLRLLLRGGFIRQSSAGIYSLLPNGQRVQQKIERIVEEEMEAIGAAKIALPNLLPVGLWEKSGRYASTGLKDRKESPYLLGPTHEEEVTALVKQEVQSYKQLPVKVYQITRKFRDEARPRAGLLRGREFTMKDLYTFDESPEKAKESYLQAKEAYDRIFTRIGVPFRSAQADSGNIGGDLSHEYLFESPAGEDTLVICTSCDYSANAEVATSTSEPEFDRENVETVCYQNLDDAAIHLVLLPKDRAINSTKLEKVVKADRLEKAQLAQAFSDMSTCSIYIDESCELAMKDMKWVLSQFFDSVLDEDGAREAHRNPMIWTASPDPVDVTNVKDGDACPQCSKPLKTSKAIEIGHIFYLSTRYSAPLGATFIPRGEANAQAVPFEMGCYGIGISRLLGAVAEICADEKGIAWPATIAPYRLVVIPTSGHIQIPENLVEELKKSFGKSEILIDDRKDVRFGGKMADAALIGHPFVVILGRKWAENGIIEIKSRRTNSISECSDTDQLFKIINHS